MATALEPATYWCHQCHTSVRPVAGTDILCPFCNGGFIEEIENSPSVYFPPHRQRSTVVFGGEPRGTFPDAMDTTGHQPGRHHPPIFHVLQAMSAILQQARQDNNNNVNFNLNLNRGEGGGGDPAADAAAAAEGTIDPMILVQNMFGGRTGNVEVFLDTGGGGTRRLPANFGDYFFGPGLDQLIQQLAENDPNRYGPPPASKTAVDAMPVVRITSEHTTGDDEAAQCAVCKDEFELGSEVRQMPCKHLYHQDCILPWLQQHNSCPVCRHEMPTDDPEYNNSNNNSNNSINNSRNVLGIRGAASGGGDSGGRGSRGFTIWGAPVLNASAAGDANESGSSRGEESRNRRASFQFPWPFRTSASPPPQAGSQASQSGGTSSGPSRGNGESSDEPPASS